jgi:hypothetical protein
MLVMVVNSVQPDGGLAAVGIPAAPESARYDRGMKRIAIVLTVKLAASKM